jgi:hypothetical protein
MRESWIWKDPAARLPQIVGKESNQSWRSCAGCDETGWLENDEHVPAL